MQLKNLVAAVAIASPVLVSAGSSEFKLLKRADDPTKGYTNKGGALGNTAGAISHIIDLIKGGTSSWNYQENPNMCEVYFWSRNVGECGVEVTCHDEETKEYDVEFCNLDGVSDFEDPRIGKCHIEFTRKKDDTPADPNLFCDKVNDGEKFPASQLASENDKVCDAEASFNGWDDTVIKEEYWCGMPLIGKNYGDMDSQGEVNDRGYADGWCGLHVTQHQKPDPSTDNYTFDVVIKDANEDVIGEMNDIDLATDQTKSVTSKLPWTLDIKAGAVDDDAVWMYYADQAWTSNDQPHHCDFGAYDSGKREGDCGFTC